MSAQACIDPIDSRRDVAALRRDRVSRPCEHHDRHAERSRGEYLRICGIAARVLAHDDLYSMGPHESELVVEGERTALQEYFRTRRQARSLRRIDGPNDVVMVSGALKSCDLAATDGQQRAQRRVAQDRRCGVGIGRLAPHVPWFRAPGRPLQEQQRQGARPCSERSIGRYALGIGMGCIDDGIDPLGAKPCGKTIRSTKSSYTGERARQHRRAGAARQRVDRLASLIARQRFGQRAPLGRAAKNEDAHGCP